MTSTTPSAYSSRGAVDCINFALEEMGLAGFSAEPAGPSVYRLNETLLDLAGNHDAQRCREFAGLLVKQADQVMVDLRVF